MGRLPRDDLSYADDRAERTTGGDPFRPEHRRQRGRQYAAGERDYGVAAESRLATVTNNSNLQPSNLGFVLTADPGRAIDQNLDRLTA
jgi:hypothetical protein